MKLLDPNQEICRSNPDIYYYNLSARPNVWKLKYNKHRFFIGQSIALKSYLVDKVKTGVVLMALNLMINISLYFALFLKSGEKEICIIWMKKPLEAAAKEKTLSPKSF